MQLASFNTIPLEFYTRTDVVQIAKDILGKVLYTSFKNEITAGIIVETEAYAGVHDKASHAYNNRRTERTEIMYHEGGCAYVYLCYGIHPLFNIVTSVDGDPKAVLIRGIEPLHGIETMEIRKGKSLINSKDGIGPGNVTKLLGIKVIHSGLFLYKETHEETSIWLQEEKISIPEEEVKISFRVGIGYAAEDALLPFRYQWVKKK